MAMRLSLWALTLTGAAAWAGLAQGQAACGEALSAMCAERLGAGAIAAKDATCQRQWAAYRACIKRMAASAAPSAAPGPRGGCSEARAERLWSDAKDLNSCVGYEGFRAACPDTPEARFASAKLAQLGCAPTRSQPQHRSSSAWANAPAAPKPGETFRDCGACPEMVVIPSGSFLMGSPADEPQRGNWESPQVRVSVSSFAMSVAEVSFADWDACVADGGCDGYQPKDRWGRGDQPVINVSWRDAKTYVRWLNGKVSGAPYRLPTEAEWEYGARAGSAAPFSWGRSITTDQANYDGRKAYAGGGAPGVDRQRTVPVKSFDPNAFGLHQMHGNLWEWVEDCWNGRHEGRPADGAAWMSGNCDVAVLRGGSWDTRPDLLRSAFRGRNVRDLRNHLIGFRVARGLQGF
ncbi:MAG: formylglycine-generating enzyme family protein [Pseudomonadota bacterium]